MLVVEFVFPRAVICFLVVLLTDPVAGGFREGACLLKTLK